MQFFPFLSLKPINDDNILIFILFYFRYAECRAKKCKVSTAAIDNTLRAIQNSETDPSKVEREKIGPGR